MTSHMHAVPGREDSAPDRKARWTAAAVSAQTPAPGEAKMV